MVPSVPLVKSLSVFPTLVPYLIFSLFITTVPLVGKEDPEVRVIIALRSVTLALIVVVAVSKSVASVSIMLVAESEIDH